MCVALALTPGGVCRCLPVSSRARRLSGGLCLPSCQGLCTVRVPCPRLNQHPRTARLARNPTSRPPPALRGDGGTNGAPAWKAAPVSLCDLPVALSSCYPATYFLLTKGWHRVYLGYILCRERGHKEVNSHHSVMFKKKKIYYEKKKHFGGLFFSFHK